MTVLEIRIRNWSVVFVKMNTFWLLIAVPTENVQEIWLTKMDYGRPNAEIGWKMANGQLLFLTLCERINYRRY